MNKAEQAGLELREIDELAAQDSILHRLSPLSKLFVTVFYIAVTVSFPKYALTRLVWMALFPVAGYQLAGLPMRLCFQKLRMVLPLVCAVGLLNPLFDRQIVVQVGTLAVSGGVLSMLTLILKGVFCLLASFLLMATTTIEAICRALRQLHVPKLLTNLLLLTFRYVGLLLSEVAVMQQAYSLRAPGAEGDSYFRVGIVSRPAAAAQHGSGAGALREYGVARVQRRIPRRCARTKLGGVVAVCTRVSGADAAGSLF